MRNLTAAFFVFCSIDGREGWSGKKRRFNGVFVLPEAEQLVCRL